MRPTNDWKTGVCGVLLGLLCSVVSAYAQDAPTEVEVAPTPEQEQVLSAGPATPVPGDEVMRPTRRGLELTPRMAEGISRLFVREEIESRCSLRDDQNRRIAKGMEDRMMRLSRERGPEGAAALEYLYESMLQGSGKIKAEEAPEFAKRMRPGLDIMRDFFDGMATDARSILDDEQYAKFEEFHEKPDRMMDLFEKKLDRYERGDVVGGEEEPFDDLDNFDAMDEEGRPVPKTDKKSEQLRGAERMAEWRVRELGPEEWRRFLDRVRSTFELDDEQAAAGRKILEEYKAKAEAIMTEDWKRRLRRNRVFAHAQYSVQDQPHRPWIFRIEQEHRELTDPLKELGRSFRREVLALATEGQWEGLFEDLREEVSKHGMTAEEMDLHRLRPKEAVKETAVR